MTARKPTSPGRESPWRPPTRRAFVAMVSAAAAALTIEHARGIRGASDDASDDRPRSPWTGKTRWIGHC